MVVPDGFRAVNTLRARRQIRLSNAQDWADFKQHWPMEVFDFFVQIVGGFLFGVALALSAFVYALSRVST